MDSERAKSVEWSSFVGKNALLIENSALVQLVRIAGIEAHDDYVSVRIEPVDGPCVRFLRGVSRRGKSAFVTPLLPLDRVRPTEVVGTPTELVQSIARLFVNSASIDGSDESGWRLLFEPEVLASFLAGDDDWIDDWM
jgi:hypothetical protein